MAKKTNESINNTACNYRQLFGRRVITTSETEVNQKNVISILNQALVIHQLNRNEEQYLLNYVKGKQPILERFKKYNKEICNRIVINRANEIVTFKTANFAGEPIQYVSRGANPDVPEKIEKLNSMMISESKQYKDMDLAYKMFTYGVAYRLVLNDKTKPYLNGDLFDEAPFELYTPEPQNTFVVRVNDVTQKVIMGVTYVYLDDLKSKIQYTVYTDNATYKIEGSGTTATKIVETITHNFGMIPLIEYPCNALYMGAFEVVLPLLDEINLLESNRIDSVEQFVQALLVFEGVDASEEQITELKQSGVIKIPSTIDGKSGRLYYLNEQLDQTQTQTLADALYQEVLQIVGMPSQGNANTSDSSNNGAVIMKNGWWNAEARKLETEGMWEQAETQLLKIVLKICKEANALDGLAISDVKVKNYTHSYEDLLVKTQSFTTLHAAGCPPIQCYTLSKLGTDPESLSMQYQEYQNKLEEKELDILSELPKKALTKEHNSQQIEETEQDISGEDNNV